MKKHVAFSYPPLLTPPNLVRIIISLLSRNVCMIMASSMGEGAFSMTYKKTPFVVLPGKIKTRLQIKIILTAGEGVRRDREENGFCFFFFHPFVSGIGLSPFSQHG